MDISTEQQDALTELINVGVGHAASTLNCLINHKIRLTVPEIEFQNTQNMKNYIALDDGSLASVSMSFKGDFDGNASLMFPVESASTLVSILTGEAPDSSLADDLRSGTLAEVGNILLNGVMGSMGNMLSSTLSYSVPTYQESSLQNILIHQKAEIVLIARANFYVDELCIEGNILLFFELESFNTLIDVIDKELML
ncbi:MAG: chemotaxis protein CheC [Mariprofundus sp.]|nr:chemotaxis protein CheC [Mariprofundus sp.]